MSRLLGEFIRDRKTSDKLLGTNTVIHALYLPLFDLKALYYKGPDISFGVLCFGKDWVYRTFSNTVP